jgi:hypothetical protein
MATLVTQNVGTGGAITAAALGAMIAFDGVTRRGRSRFRR